MKKTEKKQPTEEEKTIQKKNVKAEMVRILKFLVFSCTAGIIQFGVSTLLWEVAKLSYWPGYLIGLVLSVIYNFTINRKFTFKSANNVPLAMTLVLCYYAVFTPLSTLWGNALDGIGWNEYIVLAGTMIINFVTEFLFTRYVVYHGSVDSALKQFISFKGKKTKYKTKGLKIKAKNIATSLKTKIKPAKFKFPELLKLQKEAK